MKTILDYLKSDELFNVEAHIAVINGILEARFTKKDTLTNKLIDSYYECLNYSDEHELYLVDRINKLINKEARKWKGK